MIAFRYQFNFLEIRFFYFNYLCHRRYLHLGNPRDCLIPSVYSDEEHSCPIIFTSMNRIVVFIFKEELYLFRIITNLDLNNST